MDDDERGEKIAALLNDPHAEQSIEEFLSRVGRYCDEQSRAIFGIDIPYFLLVPPNTTSSMRMATNCPQETIELLMALYLSRYSQTDQPIAGEH